MENNKKLRILAISDTHGFSWSICELWLQRFRYDNFAGDCSNTMSPAINANPSYSISKLVWWYSG